MAKKKLDVSFNFGRNAKPKKPARKRSGSKGSKSNAWRKYVVSNAPLSD